MGTFGLLTISSIITVTLAYHTIYGHVRFLGDYRFYGFVYASWTTHLLAWVFFRLIAWPKLLSPLRNLPEPTDGRSWWNGYGIREYSGMKGSAIAKWQRELNHAGYFRYLGIFNRERLVFTTVDRIAHVLQHLGEFHQTRVVRLMVEPIIGPGLVLLNGEEHKRQRRLVLPSFSPRQIRQLFPIFWAKAVEITEKFTDIVEDSAAASGFSEPIEVDYWAGLVALDVISKAALGIDFESVKSPDSDLVRTYRGTFNPTLFWRFIAAARMIVPRWMIERIPLERIEEGKKAIDLLRGICKASVREKKSLMDCDGLVSQDIISALIRDRHVEDDEALVTHMAMMLGAGHETVSIGLTWAVYELCRNPQWQKDIRAEIRACLPSPMEGQNPPPAASIEADKMPLLNAFVSECLRYWPPIPQISRTAAVNTSVDGVDVAKGTKVRLSIVAFNRDPQNWGPDASEFKPMRWCRRDEATGALKYEQSGGATSKYSFMTFLHGPRDCVGRGFARSEMLCILACWVGRFDFVLTDRSYMDESNVAISAGGVSSKPLNGIYVHARRVPGRG